MSDEDFTKHTFGPREQPATSHRTGLGSTAPPTTPRRPTATAAARLRGRTSGRNGAER